MTAAPGRVGDLQGAQGDAAAAPPAAARPLRGLRVVTLADERLPSLGKAFVDLGADVEAVSGPWSGPAPRPLLQLLESRGKRAARLPAEQADEALRQRLERADVLVCPGAVPGAPAADQIARDHPHLVIAVISDFGLTGGRRGWTGTEAVFHALAGTLSRSGVPGAEPLLPPGEVFIRGAALQIACAIVAQLHRALRSPARRGAVLDCSLFECGAVCFDPAFGMTGSGTPDSLTNPGRPDVAFVYPIFRARDGFVRVTALAPGQWDRLLEWMGRPAALAGDHLRTNMGRNAHPHVVMPALAAFFAGMTCREVVDACRERQIPACKVLSVADVLTEAHYREVGVLAGLGTAQGRQVVAAEGMATIDGARTVPRPASAADEAFGQVAGGTGGEPSRPLAGLTVVDLGVIVAGPQAGMVLAEQGARVIRVENRQFPDGMRRSFETLTPAQARGHLGKESIGLDLRSDEGRRLFTELVARADVVLSNFKPGTLERLGIASADLRSINPAVVCVETNAFGDVGPWRTAMGYGPLVRAGSGLTWLWRPDGDSEDFGDGVTIYPDHLVGRVCALMALACALDRLRTGRGARVTVAQSDVTLVQLAELLAAESVTPGSVRPPGRPGEGALRRVVFPAAGNDQWCVVDPRSDAQVAALRSFLGIGPDADLDAAVAEHVATLDARRVATALQEAGVPAAPMLRPHELADDPAVGDRQVLHATPVAGTDDLVLVERPPVLVDGEVPPRPTPAPTFGAHTLAVLEELGYDRVDIERLVSSGVAQMADSLRPPAAPVARQPAGG
ncbi:MAG TPA: CoA transferase [Acidimicrobiales bacterium]|nr:CoA transferase [Acidimicrobiales bacterium]